MMGLRSYARGGVILVTLSLVTAATACSTSSSTSPTIVRPRSATMSATSAPRVTTQKLPGCPITLTAGRGNAFVGVGCVHSSGHLTGETLRVPAVGRMTPSKVISDAPQLAFVNDYLWAAGALVRNGKEVLAKVDPPTGKVVSSVRFPRNQALEAVAGDASGIWVVGERGTTSSGATSTLYEVDPKGARIVRSIPLVGIEPEGASTSRWIAGLAVAEGSVWLIDLGFSSGGGTIVDGYIVRIAPHSGNVTGMVSVGHTNEIAVGDGAVWTTNGQGNAIRIDAKTLKVTSLRVKNFEPFAVGEGGVWYLDRAISGPQVAVKRLDPKTLKTTLSVTEPSFPSTVGLNPVLDETSHTAWVVSDDKDRVTRINLEA